MGCPNPAKRKPASKDTRNKTGTKSIATRRKSQRRERERGAVAGDLGVAAGGEGRLERDRFMAGAKVYVLWVKRPVGRSGGINREVMDLIERQGPGAPSLALGVEVSD